MKILKEILKSDDNNVRISLVKTFQDLIWNETEANSVLSELAHDLDYYEPDESLRKEDSSYFGNERLEEEIKSALQKLNTEDYI